MLHLDSYGVWREAGSVTAGSPVGTDLAGTWVDIDGGVVIAGVPKFDPPSKNNGGGFVTVDLQVGSVEAGLQFLHTDHLGSPVAATDADGNVVGAASYYPFGELRQGTGLFDTARGFTGQIHDAGTGLEFYNARYMDSALGRFISPDSIVPNPANPSNYNRDGFSRV